VPLSVQWTKAQKGDLMTNAEFLKELAGKVRELGFRGVEIPVRLLTTRQASKFRRKTGTLYNLIREEERKAR